MVGASLTRASHHKGLSSLQSRSMEPPMVEQMEVQAPSSKRRLPRGENSNGSRICWCSSRCISDSKSSNRDSAGSKTCLVESKQQRAHLLVAWHSKTCLQKVSWEHMSIPLRPKTEVKGELWILLRLLNIWLQFCKTLIAKIKLEIREANNYHILINLVKINQIRQWCSRIKWMYYKEL